MAVRVGTHSPQESSGGPLWKRNPNRRDPPASEPTESSRFAAKNLIAVLENPVDLINIRTVIRNANALGVEKVYVVDPRHSLPDDWQDWKSVSKTSVSAVKWTFVKRFGSTDECFDHLERKGFKSIVTSPHVKGKTTFSFARATTPCTPSLRSGSATNRQGLAVARSKEARCASLFRCSV
jgi:tRNA (guanosine-2'-O-)-methyltransferase